MTAYTPQHTVRAGELAARIYEGWVVGAVVTDRIIDLREIKPEYMASVACDAAAVLVAELRRRDPITCELVHGPLPQDTDTEGYEE